MQNSKYKMQNEGIAFGDDFKIVSEVDSIILHSAFCILHFLIPIKF